MKLNLLPTYVSKEKATRGALIVSILVFVVFVLGSIYLYQKGTSDFEASKKDIPEWRGKAAEAKATADYADDVMHKAEPLLRNTNLATAMIKHNTVYPDLYDKVKRYIPSFYRVNSMSAASGGPGITTVTLVGVLDTYQQYADLMLALLRMDGVQSVSRAGFNNNPVYVPAPSEIDQYGKPRKLTDPPIPDDPSRQLDYLIGKGRVTGYQGVGGFGSGQPGLRGPMPTASQVTVTIVLSPMDTEAPDPRATLSAGGASSSGTAGPGPGAAQGALPPTGAPKSSTPPPTGRAGRRGSGAAAQDEGG